LAIDQYVEATQIAPNLTFLYISIGQNYRQLALYDQALEFFDRAASINAVLGIDDPLPYVAIAKTYSRQGEFFAAAANAKKAIAFDPTNPDLYGILGIVFFRSRNYESAVDTLNCVVNGCTPEERCLAMNCTITEDGENAIEVIGLPLDNDTVAYYYTFGSGAAALDQCESALPILELLAEEYSDDPLVMGIVEESFQVMRNLDCI
jgi:tetratricopeptide (TPR) repeat protein